MSEQFHPNMAEQTHGHADDCECVECSTCEHGYTNDAACPTCDKEAGSVVGFSDLPFLPVDIGAIKKALAGAALALSCLLPLHASAQEPFHRGQSVIIGGSNCQITRTWEDGTAMAHCRDHKTYGWDSDGSPTSAPGTWVRMPKPPKNGYGR